MPRKSTIPRGLQAKAQTVLSQRFGTGASPTLGPSQVQVTVYVRDDLLRAQRGAHFFDGNEVVTARLLDGKHQPVVNPAQLHYQAKPYLTPAGVDVHQATFHDAAAAFVEVQVSLKTGEASHKDLTFEIPVDGATHGAMFDVASPAKK